MNPTIQSGLIETPAPAANNTAPRAGTVLVVGPAGSGPDTPQVFDDAAEAYRVYGSQDTLARDIELALLGASFGARSAGSGLYGRVVGLRTRTGAPAKLALYDSTEELVMTLETIEASERANLWTIKKTASGYEVYDPTTGTYSTFRVDFNGIGSTSIPGSPTALAAAMRAAYASKLYVTVSLGSAHFEMSVDEDDAVVTSSSATSTEIDFADQSIANMASRKSGASTWIDGAAPYFDEDGAVAAHNRILSADNENARVYAITAGAVVEVPKDATTVQVPRLADAKRIGHNLTKSLLNLRTTGADGATTIEAAGTRDSGKVAEGFWRVRSNYIGRFDETITEDVELPADFTARVASTANVDISSPPATIDGVTLVTDDIVLLKNQSTATQDGLYGFTGSVLTKLQAREDITTCDVTEGTVSADLRYAWDGTDSIDAVAKTRTAIKLTFDAPAGIADEGGALAASYATYAGGDKDVLSTNRMGTKFTDIFKMELSSVLADGLTVPIALDRSGGADTGIPAKITWAAGVATLYIDKTLFAAEHGDAYSDGFTYVSFDSCLFDLTEKNNKTLLTSTTSGVEYAVAGDVMTFNKALNHALVIRPLRVTQYRLGNDVTVERSTNGTNKFVFKGLNNQPGEAGGAVGGMEVVLGFDFTFEPEFPAIASTAKFAGGTSGVNADAETKAFALEEALKEFKDQPFDILVPSGLHVDDVKTGFDGVTGEARKTSVGLLDVLQAHQSRVSKSGAAGIVYGAVKPMKPAAASGRYTDPIKRARFVELVQADPLDPARTATIVQTTSYPDFFIFDAPFAIALNGRTVITNGAAFYAGIRSAMPNDKALYQLQLPTNIQPLYRFDVPDVYMPGVLADARINTWSERRNDTRLADERTAAGLIADSRGQLVPSSFQSGIALLAAKSYLRDSVSELRNLLGPLPSTGVDTLRATVETILRGVANRTTGVQDVNIDPQRNISIYATGGNALGMDIKLFLQVNGELRLITIQVGALSGAGTNQSTQAVIPVVG